MPRTPRSTLPSRGNNSREILSAFLFLAFGTFLLCLFLYFQDEATPPAPPQDALYRQAGIPFEERVDDLIARMTLKEKVGQMALVEKNSVRTPADVSIYGLGALLSGAGAKPTDNTPEGWRTMIDGFTETSRASRLGIPIFYGIDAAHGHANVPGATVFPHLIGLGATNDPELVRRIARATAEEIAATGATWSYSPTLDQPRDIRWGRVYETFSDDPARVGTLAAAYVRGLEEGIRSGQTFILSTLKHYIGAGDMAWGSSSNENFHIDQGTTPVNEALLRDMYLPPFKEAIDAGAGSVMVGLNSWGDTKLSASRYLITDVLKGELAFRGLVVSDWYGAYEIPGSDYRGAVSAINAGVDMVMLPFDYGQFVQNVALAVRRGEITEARIDDAVRRILRTKFDAGLFDENERSEITLASVGSPEHRALAREAVAASLVLLKNERETLPIRDTVRHILVAGSAADNVGRQSGAWTVEWQGIDGNWLPGATSILQGIRSRAGGDVLVEYSLTGDFEAGREPADLGIAIVGEKPYAEGWGDTEYPILAREDIEAINRLRTMSNTVVVIMVSGRPLLIEDEIDTFDALVAAWLPGSEGAGVADALFGDVPFTGTLSLPWPRTSEQLPMRPDGGTKDGTPPLFLRGFGL